MVIWNKYIDKRTSVIASHDEVLELLEAWDAEIPLTHNQSK